MAIVALSIAEGDATNFDHGGEAEEGERSLYRENSSDDAG
jgi:hypothetical protein